MLSCRFIIPIGAVWPLRVLSFLKLTFLEGISWKITRRLFHVDARSACEKKVIRLARQTPLSCAEIIKCIEMDIRRLKDGYDVLDLSLIHISEPTRLGMISYAVFCLKKKKNKNTCLTPSEYQ